MNIKIKNNNFTTHKNRGMLLEDFINRTINYYNQNKIAYFFKKNLDVSFKKINKEKLEVFSAFITNKSTVDYYGIYKGKYVTFEAKSTELNILPFKNIKEHQHNHLKLIQQLGGVAFYIIFFKKKNEIFLLDVKHIDFRNKKSISYEEILLNGKKLEIVFPGIINFLDFI